MKRNLSAIIALMVVVMSFGLVYSQAKGSKLLSVQSGSMVPALHKGDLVSVERVPESQLAVGDVITYVSASNTKRTITHRIISKENGKIITKGDANTVADQPITDKYVLGKVHYSLPYAGHAIDFVRKPVGLALIIYVPALIIIIREIILLSEYYKKSTPYISAAIRVRMKGRTKKHKLLPITMVALFSIILSGSIAWPVQAALRSDPVILANNSFTVTVLPPTQCTGNSTNVNVGGSGGNNNSTVIINNNSSQTSATGNASSNGGTATSGNASNSNTTCINVTVHQ
ncbi:signal peptidase I [Candidatus Saccharibacteria bacterium]|nr:signal peptidase I [Candidatus Saccharibacteria bacterium]